MKVMHFSGVFSSLSQTFIYDFITELERQGVCNHVVTLKRENVNMRPFPKVRVVDEPGRWNPTRLWHRVRAMLRHGRPRVSHWPQTRDNLKQEISNVSPDVIHAHFGPEGVLIAPAAQELGVPLIVTFYGYDISLLPDEEFWQKKFIELWSQVCYVTVLSREMKESAKLLGCPDRKIQVIHLSRDLSTFQYSPPARLQKALFVGRLVPKKAPIDAVKALSQANDRGANLSLDIVGDGDLREEIESYVQVNNLAESVTLHGRVPSDEVGRFMQKADLFFLPSRTAPGGDREGTPTVLIEAQASGLLCVSTTHAGIPEMIPEANHDFLAPEGDTEALSDALVRASSLAHPELGERVEEGRSYVQREFNLQREVKKLQMVYRESVENCVR